MIQTPTADSKDEGTIAIIFNANDIWKFATISASPFNWLEAGYFYYRPSDLVWGGNSKRGNYLDKGFNVKFTHTPKNKRLPKFAIGLDDFAGTGYFSKEYLVSTYRYENFKISFGMGWGLFVGEESYKNPFSKISDSFNERPIKSDNYNEGGSPSYDMWFRGDATIFGGIEYYLPNFKGAKLKLEYDPFNYFDLSALNRDDLIRDSRIKESDINIGISFPVNKFFTVDASFIKGNTLNLNFSFGISLNKELSKKTEFKPDLQYIKNNNSTKKIFYEDLLNNLNRNRLLLQTASISDDGQLNLAISTSEHRNSIRSASYASYISKETADHHGIDLSRINVSHLNVGIELNQISFVANHLDDISNVPIEVKKRNTKIISRNSDDFKKDEFKPKVNFPVIFSSTGPALVSHIGTPEKVYFGGLNLQNISEIQFNRNLILSTELNQTVFSNFEDTISGADSKAEHVRTEIVQYLKEDDLFLSRIQLDYIWSPKNNLYMKLSAGIFERMYGGIGSEILYKPYDKNFSVGAELFAVKQRTFEQRFKFQDYETTTGHINFNYIFTAGIEARLSYGRYLAKDDGYTLDIGRRLKSGTKMGIFFTRTDMPEEIFGEGSFDKGFYFQIPFDLMSQNYQGNYSSFRLSPLTRDGGAKLQHDKDLRGLIYNTTNYELMRQWNGFLD